MRASDYTQIFWDFNGTILDDLDLGIRTVNTLLRRRGLPTLDSVEVYHSLFGFPVQDYYEKIGLWHKGEDFSPVAHEWMNQYRSEERTAPVREGIREVLDNRLMLEERCGRIIRGMAYPDTGITRFPNAPGYAEPFSTEREEIA